MSSEEEEDNVFYFESDHIALRGNEDYSNLLKTIVALEAAQVRVHNDIEELMAAKHYYLNNPNELLEKLRNNEPIVKCTDVKIPEIPKLKGKYRLFNPEIKVENEEPQTGVPPAVRGRMFDESKPRSFNQLWTCEEQRRLEQLLIEYPAEPIEQKRFAKIARALGNRTPQQVASRVQKYFLKLHNAGMPVPGRIPKARRLQSAKHKMFQKPTTFFPKLNVPVNMPEDDYSLTQLSVNDGSAQQPSCTITKPVDEKQRILSMLKIIRDEKQAMEDVKPDLFCPKCEVCLTEPQSKTRWRCNTCFTYLNQCTDCLTNQLLSNQFEHIQHDVINE
ncbi:ZZ-type zinc finger-containing protein 3-like [Teleopsis dalmanni]|uniref:ZZ-type zinc finger-containing protein 3-like n=1 Tax=Teleopsis dalmanni TaxID=139649 RepID=UPI0018CCB254|nr:ZZ-type zinc finger-containing protein 3-like [Teleopsis dalmanni]